MTVHELRAQSIESLEQICLDQLIALGHGNCKVIRFQDQLIVEVTIPVRMAVTEINLNIDISDQVPSVEPTKL